MGSGRDGGAWARDARSSAATSKAFRLLALVASCAYVPCVHATDALTTSHGLAVSSCPADAGDGSAASVSLLHVARVALSGGFALCTRQLTVAQHASRDQHTAREQQPHATAAGGGAATKGGEPSNAGSRQQDVTGADGGTVAETAAPRGVDDVAPPAVASKKAPRRRSMPSLLFGRHRKKSPAAPLVLSNADASDAPRAPTCPPSPRVKALTLAGFDDGAPARRAPTVDSGGGAAGRDLASVMSSLCSSASLLLCCAPAALSRARGHARYIVRFGYELLRSVDVASSAISARRTWRG